MSKAWRLNNDSAEWQVALYKSPVTILSTRWGIERKHEITVRDFQITFTSQFHVGSQAIREKREWTKLFSQLGLTDTRKFRSRQHLSDAPSSVKTKVSSQWKAFPFTTNQWTDKDLGILISFSRNPDYFIYCTLGWGLKSAITLSGKKGNWERQHFPMASNWFEERSTRHLAAARRIMSCYNPFLLRNGKSWT